jgi:quercetin dioxygenase-like cupin family protein
MLSFDLPEQLARIRSEETWKTAERNAITLWKGPAMRVVLVALHAGASLPDHHADGPISVHVLEGRIDFVTDSGSKSLGEGQVVTLHGGVRHRVEAHSEAAFLLTMAVKAEAQNQGVAPD